jgi:hypothetical protein
METGRALKSPLRQQVLDTAIKFRQNIGDDGDDAFAPMHIMGNVSSSLPLQTWKSSTTTGAQSEN